MPALQCSAVKCMYNKENLCSNGATSLAEAAEGRTAMPMVNIPAAAAAAIRFLMVVPLLRTFAFDL